jgi:hypothetical protein
MYLELVSDAGGTNGRHMETHPRSDSYAVSERPRIAVEWFTLLLLIPGGCPR